MKPRVFQSRPTNGPAEWVVFFYGQTQWFPTWRDAFDHAYVMSRIRNVLADVFPHMES